MNFVQIIQTRVPCGTDAGPSMSPLDIRSRILLFLVIWIRLSDGFIVIIGQNGASKGCVLFDAKVRGDERSVGEVPIKNHSSHSYRVSHHKTQPWIHRVVHFDKEGKLRLKRSLDSCHDQAPYPQNTFLVYVDIIAQQFHPNGIENTATYPFDYISFPLLIIIQPSLQCSVQVQNRGPFAEIKAQDREIQHWTRSVDDIYVSIPVTGDFCHHASEKVGNLYDFLPATVRSRCGITPALSGGDHFFGIEPSTNDIALKADFCLFESFHTSEILLRLECFPNKQEPSRLVSWDQLVHFIVHRVGPSSLKGGNVLDERHFERHPIHRIRREMRNQAPFLSIRSTRLRFRRNSRRE